MQHNDDVELEQLLNSMLEGELGDEGLSRVAELLKGNSARQEVYFEYVGLQLMLEAEAAVQADVEAAPVVPPKLITKKSAIPKSSKPKKSTGINRYSFIGPAIAWATAAIFLIGLVSVSLIKPAPKTDMARVIDSTDMVGAPLELTAEGSFIDVGLPIRFDSGLIQIAMPSGAEFVLEGPASFTLKGDNHVLLGDGKLYAKVPEQAIGFQVDTDALEIVDLGTEFGVDATTQGVTKSYVYQGKVEISDGVRTEELTAGLMASANQKQGVAKVGKFKSHEVSFHHSLDGSSYIHQLSLIKPIYYHRFSNSYGRKISKDSLGHTRHNASLKGGVYLTRGGPILSPASQDGHLRFVGVESIAEVSDALHSIRESEAYTIVLWVRVDEKGPQGIALFTNEYGPDLHAGITLRINEDRYLEHIVATKNSNDRTSTKCVKQRSATPLTFGKWYQVAISGGKDQKLNLFVDGKRASSPIENTFGFDAASDRLLLGSGSGRSIENWDETGPLRGALDELVVFDRCLSSIEIARLFSQASSVTNSAY